ncbi:RICIN domain-containing protein [Streptomyces roseirectus]|uniref:RICIN domain-containing protein n=1 Tax=Streptomyces roseirectus TaxID=2768066 RepID=A0A7H0IEX3_9ACTN|nr:RICIN domain-containing protein [Streptomyces roseirectus]QNP71339.1 RICIN domain-containing protein [Streptomyces roseirectus]
MTTPSTTPSSHRAARSRAHTRGRHRRRWTTTAVLLAVPAAAVPYLLFTQDDSQAATIDTAAYYRLISVRSGKALDVDAFSTADGTRIQQWTDQNTANQQWKFRPTNGGYYELVNRNSGKVLGIAGNSTAKSAAAVQQTDSSSTAQEWRVDETNGAFTLTSRRSGQVLDVSGGSTAQGTPVIQFPGIGSTNQRWKLVKVTPATTPGSSTGTTQTSASGPYAWKNAQVVGGGYVTGLVFNSREKNLLYARTDMGGAYRWDAGAKQWLPLTDWIGEKDWNLLGIDSLATDAADPNRLYLAAGTYTNDWAGNGAILRSTDRGRTFQRTDLPFKVGGNEDGRGAGERLVIDPANHANLLLGTRKNGLWRSTDFGSTWRQVTGFPVRDGVPVTFVTYGPAGSGTVYAGTADKSAPLYRSTDGGTTWKPVAGQPTGQLPQHGVLSGDGTLYLTYTDALGPNGVTAGSVWKYTASGVWKNISPSQGSYGFSGLAVDPRDPSTVMVTTLDRWWPEDEIYRTTDGGSTWKALAEKSVRDASAAPYVGTGVGHWMTALAIDPFDSGHVLYGTGNGIWRSQDANASDTGGTSHWTVGAQGLEETALLDAVAPPGGGTLVTAMGDQGGFHYDGALTKVPTGRLSNPLMTNSTSIDFAQSSPSTMVRVGRGGKQDGAYSTDGGRTWTGFTSEPVPSADSGHVALSADGSAIVWTESGQAPYRSTDRGTTWSRSAGLPANSEVVADRSTSGTFYSLSNGTLYASTDAGATFTPRATNLPGGRLSVTPGAAGDLWLSGGSGGLLHSTDAGRTFTKVSTVQSASALGFGKPAPGSSQQTLYVIATVNNTPGVYRSTDRAATWVRVNDNAHQWGALTGTAVITGDPDTFGRVYIGTNGRGLQYGDPS